MVVQELNQRLQIRTQPEAFRFSDDEPWTDSSSSRSTISDLRRVMELQAMSSRLEGLMGGMQQEHDVEPTDNHFQIEVLGIDKDDDPVLKIKQLPRALIDNITLVKVLGGEVTVNIGGGGERVNFAKLSTDERVIHLSSKKRQQPGWTRGMIWRRYHSEFKSAIAELNQRCEYDPTTGSVRFGPNEPWIPPPNPTQDAPIPGTIIE